MASKKETAEQEERTLEACLGLNKFLYELYKKTHNPNREFTDFAFDNRASRIKVRISEESDRDWRWDFLTSSARRVDGGRNTTVFHKAYEGLTESQRKDLEDLSSKALQVAQAVQENKLKFKIGESTPLKLDDPLASHFITGGIKDKFSVRFDIVGGATFEDVQLYLPTWGGVASQLLDEETIRRFNLDEGLILETEWERGYTESMGTAFGGDAYSNTVDTSWEYFRPITLATNEGHFLMLAKDAEEVETGVTEFRGWLKRKAMPRAYPVIDQMQYILNRGYEARDKEEELASKKRKSAETKKGINELEGKEI